MQLVNIPTLLANIGWVLSYMHSCPCHPSSLQTHVTLLESWLSIPALLQPTKGQAKCLMVLPTKLSNKHSKSTLANVGKLAGALNSYAN